MVPFQPYLLALGIVGVIGGVIAFLHGLGAYRREAIVASIATSSVDGLAAGEVRLSGTVQALGVTLVSALQSAPCVWYHARVVDGNQSENVLLDEQRGVEFLLKDDTGIVRVVPRDLHAEVDPVFDASTDLLGDDPIGLDRRSGPSSMVAPEIDRQAAINALLTVRPAMANSMDDTSLHSTLGFGGFGMGFNTKLHTLTRGRRHYVEQRISPGDRVTIIGTARPYGEVDPIGPEATATLDPTTFDDPTLAADMEEARATGALADTARQAWGNAAIPGFGIGHPTELPVLDANAAPEVPDVAIRSASAMPNPPNPVDSPVNPANPLAEPTPETLVIAGADSTPLTVYAGSPEEATAFDRDAFYRGLCGAALAIAAACAVAATWGTI
jgi:hypothetical protein